MRRCILAIVAFVLVALPTSVSAAAPNHAGLIVRSNDGKADQRCVAFDEQEISGEELLARSKLDIVVDQSTLGVSICSIDGRGCSSDDCFCKYPTFWGYWTRDPDENEWRFSDVGASDRVVRDGALDGWSFGKDGKPPPSDVSFEEICAAPASARADAPSPARSVPNYLPFAGFLAAFAAASVLLFRRRRQAR